MNYQALYAASIADPSNFWSKQASEFVTWEMPWDRVYDYDFTKGEVHWYSKGKLNVSKNCLDRHVQNDPNKIALLWEGNDPRDNRKITYQALLDDVCKLANVLKELGVKKRRSRVHLPTHDS